MNSDPVLTVGVVRLGRGSQVYFTGMTVNEGLCFGPDLPNGDHLLIVTADNDFRSEAPNLFYVFAAPADDLPGYVRQQFKK